VELGLRGRATAALEVGGNLTWMDHRNRSDPGQRALGAPERKLFLFAQWQVLPQVDLQATVEHNGPRWASNTVELAGWTVLGLKAGWLPLPGWKAVLAVDNAADKLYALDAGFPSPGRTWTASLRHAF
jgi:iron complex outermembrane receptor protein